MKKITLFLTVFCLNFNVFGNISESSLSGAEPVHTAGYDTKTRSISAQTSMVFPKLECSLVEVICDMDLLDGYVGLMPDGESPGAQPIPLCPEGGAVGNISWIGFIAPEGIYEITISPDNCSGAVMEEQGMQVGVYVSCDFPDAIFCEPNCRTSPISIESSYFEPGEQYYLFIDGCFDSVCEYEINISGTYISQCEDPCDDGTPVAEWAYEPAGDFNGDYNIITYSTAPNLLDVGGLDHLVFYDYNNGNVYLKENNGNGFLDNEILLFNNEDHYANGTYKIYLEDIDNDGLTDIILAESNIVSVGGGTGDRLSVYQNMGGGDFVLQINEQVCEMQGPDELRIADFDNDGMKDIFFVCTDFLYDILWVNSWSDVEKSNFEDQTFCYVYTGDFNQDGLQDLGISKQTALINNGDRSFTSSTLIVYENECETNTYYVDETGLILDPIDATSIIDPSALDTDFCSFHNSGSDNDEIFRAYITSPNVESIIVSNLPGFHMLDLNLECGWPNEDLFDAILIPNVVARQNTKIDLTLNGCTDFLVLDGNQIFAWINPKESNKIIGTTYIDENNNGIFDSNELPLRNVLVSISPGDIAVLTDDDGNYSISVPEGVYTLTATVNEGEWIESELLINNIQISEPCNEGYNFGFVSNSGAAEMATLSMANTIARCDFATRFTITVENTGAEMLDGILYFNFDDETNFFSSDIVDFVVNSNTVIADVGPLDPFSPQTYNITVKMPGGSSSLPMLAFNAQLFSTSGELIEEYGYFDQLRCSYDPNDKREYPDRAGEQNLTLMEEDIEYTIRFQNNGNDTAFLVTIVDPIDPNIDPSSIRVMSSSHEVETYIQESNLIFLFEDILLVDSMTNYPASQGYVTFRCNAKEGRAEMTLVNNQADIIFDTNEPIITNETVNTLVSVLCMDKDTLISATICDGESYLGYTESGLYTQVVELQFGCDSVVVIALDVQGITLAFNTVDLCFGDNIFYNGVLYEFTESTLLIDTLYNDNNCISDILSLQVNVAEVSYSEEEISACEGDEIVVNGTSYIFTESSEILDSTFDSNGCVIAVMRSQITITPILYEQLDTTICEGFSVLGLSEPGSYIIGSLDSTTGCEVELTLNLEVLPAQDPACTVGTSDMDARLVNIYPNPATESLFIETDNDWETISIINIEGKMIANINDVSKGKQELNISKYSSGVYMMIFQSEAGMLTKRFVVR